MAFLKSLKSWSRGRNMPSPSRLLQEKPAPLISNRHKIVLVFSAKSACSASVIWFYKIEGLYDEARNYHHAPHEFRSDKYYDSHAYLEALSDATRDYRFIRVIRDPYQRAVSSYRHALFARYWNKKMARHTRRQIDDDSGYSFSEFLDQLEREDLSAVNIHNRLQMHPLEKHFEMDDVINVSTQDLFAELNRIERESGMEKTEFADFDWFHSAEKKRVARIEETVRDEIPHVRFCRRDARNAPWPKSELFLTDVMRAKVRQLYARDFDQYAEHLEQS